MLSGNISLTSEYSKLVPSAPHLWSEIILHALRLTQCLLCISCSVCVLFLFLIIYFNWRLITLQYCGSIHWHESAKDVHVSPFPKPLPLPSPSHPSGLSQCTSFECPVSCIKLGLVIYFTYGNIHVSMLFSQIIPPSLSPTESKICSLYLCLYCCLMYRVVTTIFLNSICIYVNMLSWCFSFWLISLCIIGSSLIHLIRTDSNALFLIAE